MNKSTPCCDEVCDFTVLLVEDEKISRSLIKTTLAPCVKKLHTATDGHEGILAFGRYNPDIVISDILMPRMNGLDMVRAIRSMKPKTPVILITVLDKPEYLKQALEIGATDYLVKPFSDTTICEAMRRTCAVVRADRELKRQKRFNELMLAGLPEPALLMERQSGRVAACNKYASELGFTIGQNLNDHLLSMASDKERVTPISLTDLYRETKLLGVSAFGKIWNVTVNPLTVDLVLVCALDITEQKRLEHIRHEVERIIRHDLKSPINSMIGLVRVFKETQVRPEQREYLELMDQTGMKMLNMIDSSMDLIKMEAGEYQVEETRFDLMDLLEDIRRDQKQLALSRSVSLDINAPVVKRGGSAEANNTMTVMGERLHLENLFTNLLVNALEAAPRDSAITISVTKDSVIRVDIHNQGAVPAAVRENFFEPYATCGKAWGTGLGTYNARLIARAHGGDVTFATSEKNGTTLFVKLPIPAPY